MLAPKFWEHEMTTSTGGNAALLEAMMT